MRVVLESDVYYFHDLAYFVRRSTLNTGMGQEMLQALILLEQTKFLSMKLPVALQSRRAQME